MFSMHRYECILKFFLWIANIFAHDLVCLGRKKGKVRMTVVIELESPSKMEWHFLNEVNKLAIHQFYM